MDTIGRYRLFDEIGRGSMWTVYLGHDPFLDRQVAVKVAEPAAEATADQAEIYRILFYNETRAAGVLRHPYIVQVFDAGIDDGRYFIAMEFVSDGRTLDHWCHRRSLAPVKVAAEIVFKCAEALDYAHRKGVIHRDIKPANVLVTERLDVKLVDFSIALLTDPHLLDTQLLPSAGSPLYMSPEQAREEPVGNQSDLFSLGVVLYELLTGVNPFAAGTFAGVVHRIQNETPQPVEELRPGVPVSLRTVLERALAKRPCDRYASAYDLAAGLGQAFSELESPQDGVATEGRADLLGQLSFFDGFDDAEVWELLRWADWCEYDDGVAILREGEEGDSFFILVTGEVTVRKASRDVTALGPGECFGEIGYLSNHRRTASIIARGPACVLRVHARDLHRASASCQLQFQRVFIGSLIERLVQTTEALARAGQIR